jgi:isoleucyl-tRNA synthetase
MALFHRGNVAGRPEIKNTLNLPKTSFSMKANLPKREPQVLEAWSEVDVYRRIRESRRGRPTYVLHDGPPYANGEIHMGHAINKILKDLIVKSQTLLGFDAPYVPGWDCHGLPIEIKVDQSLGPRKASMSKVEIRRECRRYAERFIELQRREFKRLGIFGEWDDPYLTMAYRYEADITRAFGEFVGRGFVYKGLKPVHWCFSCRTALAEAEVEYEDHTSPSVYVAFPVRSDLGDLDPALAGRDWSVVIWTTTPWTLPANLAIAFHPDFEYSAVRVGGRGYIVATELLKSVADKARWTGVEEVARVRGRALEGRKARHPWIDRDSVFVLGDYVTLEAGTGAVHTAPGHGQDDYVTGVRYGLEILNPVDDAGRFQPEVELFGGLPVFEANPKIVEHLRSIGALLGFEEFSHSYPHCWRCHNPILFRATPQWFIALDHEGFRERVLDEIKRVHWIPAWGEERIGNMVRDRPDWCISRQRAWGVPITVFYCESCGETLLDKSVIDHVAGVFEAEGADAWYAREAKDLVPPGTACRKCGSTVFRQEFDILDVWFDSGSSHLATLGKRPDLPWPADMYIEGGDQYRGWFQSSLLIGAALRGKSPYRASITHGWTLDEQGRAMSKSQGIGVGPDQVVRERGAEILRLLSSSVNYVEDVRIFDEMLDRVGVAYFKIRNTCRFMLGNLANQLDPLRPRFNPSTDAVPYTEMLEIDRWALARLVRVAERCRAGYEQYQFHQVYTALYNFCTVDLSSFYFDVLKDRLYTAGTRSLPRRSAQTALHYVLDAFTRLVAPILPFTAEEIWHSLYEGIKVDSIHVQDFPAFPREYDDPALVDEWKKLEEVRSSVLKALDEARQAKTIGSSLEAKVVLTAGSETTALLDRHTPDLRFLFIVSQVELRRHADGGAFQVQVDRADGAKCERCWNYSTAVGSHAAWPTLCERCVPVVEGVMGLEERSEESA